MYTCNITGKTFNLQNEEKHREGASRYGYNSRFRALSYVLTTSLFGKCKILSQLNVDKGIKGIGMSDESWSDICKEKFNYTNTFIHKEPLLDIYNNEHCNKFLELDFIVSSDVFEHISPYPNIQLAFDNLYKMLKNGGNLIFSVPYSIDEDHREHYPSLYKYKIENKNNQPTLYNTTIYNKKETFKNLFFHGDVDNNAALELRVFSEHSVICHLKNSGFKNIVIHTVNSDMNKYGIFWGGNNSFVISAKK